MPTLQGEAFQAALWIAPDWLMVVGNEISPPQLADVGYGLIFDWAGMGRVDGRGMG